MEREEFKQKLTEQVVFDDIKDKIELNTMAQLRYYLVEKDLYKLVDSRRLYVKLVNYRIKKYGTSILNIGVEKTEHYKYIINRYL